MKVKEIQDYLNEKVSPYAWQRVKLRLLPHLKKIGKYFHTISDHDELKEETLDIIHCIIEDMYNQKLNLKEAML